MGRWSVGSGKMTGIPSLNTNTLTNVFCQAMNKGAENKICAQCYSVNMLQGFRKNCTTKFESNSEFMSAAVHDLTALPPCPANIGRFHSHGELINITHLINIFNICKGQRLTTFTLWTKRNNLINRIFDKRRKEYQRRPANLILIYSNPDLDKVMTEPPPYFDKVFNNVTDHNRPDINCVGKCIKCMTCYTKGNKIKSIIEGIK